MQRGNGGRDPFAGFGGFSGFDSHGSLVSPFFGRRDPFDDPFFTHPFGSMFASNMLGPSMFGPSGSLLQDFPASGFFEHEAPPAKRSKGPVIKEITSEDEGAEEGEGIEEKGANPRNHSSSSKEPYVEEPDDEVEERNHKHVQNGNDYNGVYRTMPQAHSFSLQSSTLTYGGANGAYYTSSTNRRAGGDGVMIEENKEADTTTRRATHRISKGIRDKGHSVTRNLNSDGMVDSMQNLHNLNEDELAGFEEAWKGNARKHLPGWNEGFNVHGNIEASTGQNGWATTGGWALPSTEHPERMGVDGGVKPSTSNRRAQDKTRIIID